MNKIIELCKKYSNLSDVEIDFIKFQVDKIETDVIYKDLDVFIDILNIYSGEALVIYHKPPSCKQSLYKYLVVGQSARRENEPAVLRTLETGLISENLTAKSQENIDIKQKVYNITFRGKTIAVMVIEELIDIQSQIDNFKLYKGMEFINPTFADILEDAVLIFNYNGFLVQKNKVADEYYKLFGYIEDILGLHYDNLSFYSLTFEEVIKRKNKNLWDNLLVSRANFNGLHFDIRQFFIETSNIFVVILRDKTEIKVKEDEITLKSTVIKEIHHRVKNNLQTIISLLRIQRRRTDNEEVKKLLDESLSRMFAVCTTHQLLSKQFDDNISLKVVLNLVVSNIKSCFNSNHIDFIEEIDDTIILSSEMVVTLALIVNELVQNSYEHAFTGKSKGTICLKVFREQFNIFIELCDNGIGFNQEKSYDNLGMEIVNSYVRSKLHGEIIIKSNKHGTNTKIFFKT